MASQHRFFQLLLFLCTVSSFAASGQEQPPSPKEELAPPQHLSQDPTTERHGSGGLAVRSLEIDRLFGIPFMHSGNAETREEIVQRIKKSILDRLPELSGYPKDFSALKQHKAVAISYGGADVNVFAPYLYQAKYIDPDVDYWGGEWNDK